MTTIALPRPIPPHRSSSAIVTLSSPIALETIDTQQVPCATPLPNKHLPVCPTGPAPVQEPNTPPPSPAREHSREHHRELTCRPPSLLHPPGKYPAIQSGSLSVYELEPKDIAAAVDYISRQPLPDPSQVFPWFHGLHPSNHIQQAFFVARKRSLKKTPNCLRGVTVVKADGDLAVSRLKGAIAPHEFMQPGSDGEFADPDPKDGFSVRNFQIQAAKTAITSDIIVYGEDSSQVRKLGFEVASAQAKWREKLEKQGHDFPEYNTFICISPFAEFERSHGLVVAVDSRGHLTGSVLDFFHQERTEMYDMAQASEISHNVWLGPTPEPGMNPAGLEVIARSTDNQFCHAYLDFPSSGSIFPPTWSHAEADAILDTCKWIWHLAHGILPPRTDTDVDGDSNMSDGSDATEVETSRPRKVLIHCADGYTESTMLGIAYYSYSTGRAIPEAWLSLHTEMKRNFFAYPTDVSLLTSIAARLLHESPVCAEKSLSEITNMVKHEPRWLALLDGSLPSRVLDYMYLGNLGHANNPELLRAMGITQILSVGETPSWKDGEKEEWGTDNMMMVQNVQDNGIDPLTDQFERCLKFIDQGHRNGTATLVHCRVGVSRSATICIAEVMRALDFSFPRAYCFVRARRLNVIIQPHLRFAYELLKWEELLQTTRQWKYANDAACGMKRELEWGEIAREIALMNRPYAR
ncbi:hypothetical protein F4778DRAFT_187764 [Xylariomycetidae sp. FL2044]|nr:hypothetical protein F4778DRAFT_187764 [Xylariomycetidae sp. FL2044]